MAELRQDTSGLHETIAKLHSEREDLMQKIQAGEGTNAALQQAADVFYLVSSTPNDIESAG